MAQRHLFRFLVGTGAPTAPGYTEFLWRFLWLVACISIIAYASYLYFGSISAASQTVRQVISVRDTLLKPGEHHLSGTVRVPSPCHDVTLKTQEISDSSYRLVFTTWQEPTRTCDKREEVRFFSTVVFAPPYGITFSASLDGEEIPIEVLKLK